MSNEKTEAVATSDLQERMDKFEQEMKSLENKYNITIVGIPVLKQSRAGEFITAVELIIAPKKE